jgi:LysM repeat protein
VKRTTLLLLLMTMLALFALTACEIPAPDSENIPATATAAALATTTVLGTQAPGATLQQPLAGSPTPALVATLDPNLPLPASPTPTIDPAAPVVEPTPLPAAPEATAEPTAATSSTGETIHIVQPGDNLFRIGLRYGFTYQELAAYNGITNPDSLTVGQQIKIPPRP